MPEPFVTVPSIDVVTVSHETRLALFRLVLLHRIAEERVIALYRQGRVPGSVYTGRGQEAVGAAAGLALGPDDVIAPLNREMAAHIARGVTVADVFRNYLGKGDGPTRGRDGNMHFGKASKDVFPLVSMLGDLCPVTVGAALAFKRRGEARVAMTFWGDGAFSVGDIHEGLNLAGVLHVPAVFVIQRNGYAYSTPTKRQMLNTSITERVRGGWSLPCEEVDGTDAISTYAAVHAAVERARAGEGPQVIEAVTLRMEGHAAHDAGTYMDSALKQEYAAQRDPVERLAARLLQSGMSVSDVDRLRTAAVEEVAAGLAEAEQSPAPDPATLEDGVYSQPV